MESAPVITVFDEITDFLATRPSLEQIIDYKLPAALEQRAIYLLERNSDGLITADENLEMEEFMLIEHFMTVLKAKARLQLMAEHDSYTG